MLTIEHLTPFDPEKTSAITPHWTFYFKDHTIADGELTRDVLQMPDSFEGRSGKFMLFSDQPYSAEWQDMIREAIDSGVATSAKHTTMFNPMTNEVQMFVPSLVTILYTTDGNNYKHIIELAQFLIERDLVRRTKTGKLYNISFKLDEETLRGEYGDDFKPTIKLGDLFDLETGEVRDAFLI